MQADEYAELIKFVESRGRGLSEKAHHLSVRKNENSKNEKRKFRAFAKDFAVQDGMLMKRTNKGARRVLHEDELQRVLTDEQRGSESLT